MKIEQSHFEKGNWYDLKAENPHAHLVLAFGNRFILEDKAIFDKIKHQFPNAEIVLGSTSGEIYADGVKDESVHVTSIEFENACVTCITTNIQSLGDSKATGIFLAQSLKKEGLRMVFILSDGGIVNGTELVHSFSEELKMDIPITGGLAGDGDLFTRTLVGLNTTPESGNVVAIGFYGDNLVIGTGMMGGWEVFGIEREVTRSEKNVLYEIDGKSALDLYKIYLGKYADELPGAALLFPLALKTSDKDYLVRTILSIDENNKSMTFAGNIPQGSKVRMMKANIDRLIDSVTYAAHHSSKGFENTSPELALLISCVGRKIVLGPRVDEEIASAREIFGSNTKIAGFYSYGEISPFNNSVKCELHNQSMTIITLSEQKQ